MCKCCYCYCKAPCASLYVKDGHCTNFLYYFFFLLLNRLHGFSLGLFTPLSTLQTLGKLKTDHPLLIQIQEFIHKINADQTEIVFMWVPGHVGI